MKYNLPRLVASQPIPADTIDRFIAAVESLSQLHFAAPLGGSSDPGGVHLCDETPEPFTVKLGGSISPYSWMEVYWNGSGWSPIIGGKSGSNGYEYNNDTGLDGLITTVTPVGNSWYKFLFQRQGGTSSRICYLTIQLIDYATGDPIMGATVTGYATFADAANGTPVIGTGTTDSMGEFTISPATALAGALWYTLEWDGVIISPQPVVFSLIFPCPPLQYCYCKAVLTVLTPAAANANVTGFSVASGTIDTSTPGTTIFTYKNIDFCSLHRFGLPATFDILAIATMGEYIPNCTTEPVSCDDDTTITLPMFDWSADYWSYVPSCDLGCPAGDYSKGEGPNFRGVFPKTLFANWSAKLISTGADVSALYFGTYAGVDISCTWNGTIWESVCLSGGNVRCPGVGMYGPFFLSNRVTIGIGGVPTATWFNFVNAGCSMAGFSPPCVNSQITEQGSDNCQLTAPVDQTWTVDGGPAGTVRFTVHVHE